MDQLQKELLVLSYANKDNVYLHNYINSLKKYKYNYKIIGNNEKWENFITKIKACYNYLIDMNIDYDLICITDSYDVLSCGNVDEFLHKFKSFNKDIVFSAETNCTSGKCIYLNNYYNSNKLTGYKYLNSGFYIGKYKSIINLLEFILNESKLSGITDDQFLCCLYVQKNPENVGLDTECKLIGTICYNIFDYKWYNNRVYNKKTKQYVCFIHTPCMNSDFSYRLNYFGNKILKQQYIQDKFYNKVKNFISHVKSTPSLKLYLIIILLILILIISNRFNYKIVIISLIIILILIK